MTSTATSRGSARMLLRGPAGRGGPAAPMRRLALARATSAVGVGRAPWQARLSAALENDAFVLHYQPVLDLRDGSVSHHELLLRLADEPGGRLVAPGRFLPAAERCGLIRQIDRMVLGRALSLLRADRSPRPLRLAVNVSAVSVTDEGMLAAIARGLRRQRVEPERLIVEVTETSVISDMARARAFCEGVMSLGCEIALDDFGAGFGSFQYLKQLPFSQLKIDGDFIRRLPVSRTDQLIVRALAGIVRGMGRQTTAEFVGDRPTMSLLRDYGVDYAQGFEIGPPAPRPLSGRRPLLAVAG